jgi:hypothetical protein
MKTDNELIAEFMGIDFTTKDAYLTYPPPICKRYGRYDQSWDWLMPVVEKINSIEGVSYIIEGKCAMEIGRNGARLAFQTTDSMIETVYNTVIQFIKWHNSQST